MQTTIDLSGARTREELAKKLIENTNGRIFSCAVVTKNTTHSNPRVFNCRTGVKKYLKGGKSPVRNKPTMITVYENNSKGYRTLNLSKIIWVTIGGVKFYV